MKHISALRSEMNDFEDQAAKTSAEGQQLITTAQALGNDVNAKTETRCLREDLEQMMKAEGQICSQIIEKQRKIISLESDSSTLAQACLNLKLHLKS